MIREEVLEKRLRLLVNFGGVVSRETNLSKLLELIAEQVKNIIGCDRCSVFLIDPETRELWSKVALGLQNTEIRVPFGKGIVGNVASTGQTIKVLHVDQDPRFTHDLDRMTGYRTRSILAVPLKNVAGKIIGVFEAMNKTGTGFDAEDEGILQLISSLAASGIENAELYQSLSKSQLETIQRLAITAEYRDQHDVVIHLRHIRDYSALIAQGLRMPEEEVELIRYASLMHDIGKVGIADAILLKPGKLTAEEYEEMKKHTLYGAKILCNAESELLKVAYKVASSHHEKVDGTGYPARLRDGQIPIYAKIVSVADVFDALCAQRVYKPRWEPEKAREYIRGESGKSFDPVVVGAFERVFDEILKIHALGDDRTTISAQIIRETNGHSY